MEECKDATSLEEVCEFLDGGDFPKGLNSTQRKRLVVRAYQFMMVDKHLYHKGKDGVLQRVPIKEEIVEILQKMHEEACGGHFSHDIILRKFLLTGFTWPSISQRYT